MSKKDTASPDLFKRKCSEYGLRITPQRVVIYEQLANAKDHPSAETIFKKVRKNLPNISFDTVYRTLLSFSKIGIVNLVEGYGETKRFEPNLHNHHHFRCIQCHKIIDFCNDLYDKLKIPEDIEKQFQVFNKRVVLEGLCKDCGKRK